MQYVKNKNVTLIVAAIIAVVFNVVAFVLPFQRGDSFWVGYSFAMIAIALTTIVSIYAFDREGLRSRFYRIPLVMVAWIYLVTQTIISILGMVIHIISFEYPLVLNVILLGACLIGLIASKAGVEVIERIDAKVANKVFYIKALQADVEGFVSRTNDDSLRKPLKDLVDTIRYSDPMSNPQLAPIENKIETMVAMLSKAIDGKSGNGSANDLINEIQQLFAERNRKCKLLK